MRASASSTRLQPFPTFANPAFPPFHKSGQDMMQLVMCQLSQSNSVDYDANLGQLAVSDPHWPLQIAPATL